MNKKALSAFLAMSSMAGVMAPSMTAFAAEENKNTVEDLITYAKNAKDLYHYNQAYAAIMADKDNANFNTWLGELAPVAKEIKGYDEMMKIIAEIQDEVQKNQSIEQYNAVVAKVQSLFDNGSICKTDKEYLDAELVYWTRTPIFTTQSDLKTVIDKTNEAAQLLADGKAKEAQTAIDAAKAVLAGQNNINEANEIYLQQNTVAPVAQNVADAVAKLPIEVVSATAINPMEFEVKFDAPVDRDTAINPDNYVFSLNGKAIAGFTKENAKLNADGTSVIFRLPQASALANGAKYTVDVSDGIYSADKSKKVALTSGQQQIFNDTEAPKLVSANIDGNDENTLDLVFNEPVNFSNASVKVDGTTLKITARNNDSIDATKPGNYTVKVTASNFNDSLTAIGTHNVVVYKVSDECSSMANNANTLKTQFEVSKNSQDPAVTDLVADNDDDRAFYITFDKNVDINTIKPSVKKGDVKFDKYITVTGWDMDNDVKDNDGNVKAVKVEIADKTGDYDLYKDDETSVNLKVKLENYATATGYIGQKFEGDVSLSKDAAGPQMKLDQCKLDNTANPDQAANYDGINIVFNKDIKNIQKSKIVVTDKDGISRTINTAELKAGSKDTVQIKLSGFDSSDYENKAPFTVDFKDEAVQKDATGTPIYNTNQSVKVYAQNTVKPEIVLPEKDVTTATQTVDGIVSNTITITYPQEMTATATNLANYTLDGEALPEGTTISMAEGNRTVTITLPEGSVNKTGENMFEISKNVTTKDGSMIVGNLTNEEAFSKKIELTDNVKPTMENAKFVVLNKQNSKMSNMIQVKFSEDINQATLQKVGDGQDPVDNFKVLINGNKQTIVSLTTTENKDTIDVVLAKEISVDSNTIISVVPVGDDDNDKMVVADMAGNTLAPNKNGMNVSGVVQATGNEEATINTSIAKVALSNDINAANALVDGIKAENIGNGIGQYPQDAVNTYKNAIKAAETARDLKGANAESLTAAKTTLDAATKAFNAAKVQAGNSEALQNAINAANAAVKAAVVGNEEGQYPQNAKDTYVAAIAAAQAVLDDAANKTQEQLTQAANTLNEATTAFNNAKIKKVTKIVVTGAGSATTITSKSGTLQMSAAVTPDNATNKAVTWSVDKDNIATIDASTGLLTAKADGKVMVTATAKDGSGITGQLEITVSNQ